MADDPKQPPQDSSPPPLHAEVIDESEKKNGWGGKREGAGRPPGNANEEVKIRHALRRRWLAGVESIADKIFTAHADLALGHFYEMTDVSGNVRIYTKPPNPMALEWMMEHIWGKAPQKLEVETPRNTALAMTPELQSALAQAISHAIPAKRRAAAADPTAPTGQDGSGEAPATTDAK